MSSINRWVSNGDGTYSMTMEALPIPGAQPECPECGGVGWSTPKDCLSGLCETCFPDAPPHLKRESLK